MRTAIEKIGLILSAKGYEVLSLRQPVSPSTPGYVTFRDPRDLAPVGVYGVVRVLERFLEYDDDLVERIARAERELRAAHEWRKDIKTEPEEDGSSN